MSKSKCLLLRFDDQGLYEAGVAFYKSIPTEWEPTQKEYIAAMKKALDALGDRGNILRMKDKIDVLSNNVE